MLATNSTTGPEWLMFRRNHKRNAVVDINESTISENSTKNDIILYPNPSSDNLIIKSNLSSGKIEVYTVTGVKLINTEFTENLDISGLTAGVYLCKIVSGNIIETHTFVVAR